MFIGIATIIGYSPFLIIGNADKQRNVATIWYLIVTAFMPLSSGLNATIYTVFHKTLR